MSKGSAFLFIIAFLFVLSGCRHEEYPGFTKGKNNVYYQYHYRSDDTTRPFMHSWVTLNMDYRLEDTVLFSSRNRKELLRFSMIEPIFPGDLYDGLSMMHVGDSMSFAIVADSFFLKTAGFADLPDFVTPGSPMYYDVRLLNVQNDEEYAQELEERKKQLREEEKTRLQAYLEENKITVPPTESGLYYLPLDEGYGRRPDTGDMCRVFLEVSILGGDFLYSNFEGTPIDVEYGKGFDTEGFREGLGMTRIGGTALLIVPSPIGVGERGRELVPPFTTVIYKIMLDTIRTVEEVHQERLARKKAREAEKQRLMDREKEQIAEYRARHQIREEPMPSGLIMVPIREGTGKQPEKGDKVRVHYILYDMNDHELESSYRQDKPVEFPLGKGRAIRAWDKAIPEMKKGGKVKVIAPSSLAFGTRGKDTLVAPYQPVVFVLELLED
ncbi:MAG: FKBP-type peptidyl-prolyl cis-trans isomerase [bacterium]